MLERFFSAPKTLSRLRKGPSGPYIDGFAKHLAEAGYSSSCAVRYLRVAAHLGHFLDCQGKILAEVNTRTATLFRQHLSECRCPISNGGQVNHHTFHGVKCFHGYLVELGICADEPIQALTPVEPELIIAFRDWLQVHRGAKPSTCRNYCRYAGELLSVLGNDSAHWSAHSVRAYFLSSERGSAHSMEKRVTAARSFLRYLIAQGRCRSDLDQAVPKLAHWRLASLPPSLSAEQVERVHAACKGDSPSRIRDRAIILLLLRLGLRAGDVARMQLSDIDWCQATLCVSGKGRYEVALPLSQDVGDALLQYLECRPRFVQTDRVFVSNIAPYRSSISNHAVCSVVKRTLARAGIDISAKGAHLLRHTAATQMLRQGVSLEQIGSVLRHRRVDTTAFYAKVDRGLLRQVVQAWPGAV